MTGDDRGAGRVVPAYALTGGRTRPAVADLPIEALVTATERARWADRDLPLEQRQILGAALGPVSLWELATRLELPVGVIRVLVGDLARDGWLTVRTAAHDETGAPSTDLLTRLLEGLRAR